MRRAIQITVATALILLGPVGAVADALLLVVDGLLCRIRALSGRGIPAMSSVEVAALIAALLGMVRPSDDRQRGLLLSCCRMQ